MNCQMCDFPFRVRKFRLSSTKTELEDILGTLLKLQLLSTALKMEDIFQLDDISMQIAVFIGLSIYFQLVGVISVSEKNAIFIISLLCTLLGYFGMMLY